MAHGDQFVLNVLVIDDDESVRNLLVNIITKEEHQAVAAVSAERGLELLPFWTFHVAFIDQHLPGMDGIVLGEYLKRNYPDMSVAIVSGDDNRVDRRSRECGLMFIAKPFRVDDIIQILDDTVKEQNNQDPTSSIKSRTEYYPPFAAFYSGLAEDFAMPKVPSRIEDKLVAVIRRCLNDMSRAGRYNERDRVCALSGLLASAVLGIQLPRGRNGSTLFQEYDEIMRARGKATEFE